MRRHFFNESFFSQADSPEKAYWLGFIAADGCVSATAGTYAVVVGLAARDAAHLERLASSIGYTGAIRQTSNGAACLSLYSQQLVRDLIRQGISPRKSFTCLPWEGPEHLMRDYWRGVFDGDGGFSRQNTLRGKTRSRPGWAASLTGSRFMVEAFREFICQCSSLPFSRGHIAPHASVWRVDYRGIRPSQKVAGVLYQDGDIALKRKADLAREIIQVFVEIPIALRFSRDLLQALHQQLGSWPLVAANLGVSYNGLYKALVKLGIPRPYWAKKIV